MGTHKCIETFYITSRKSGFHNNKYDDVFKAVDYLWNVLT